MSHFRLVSNRSSLAILPISYRLTAIESTSMGFPKFEVLWKRSKILFSILYPRDLKLGLYFILALIFIGVSSLINIYTQICSKLVVDSLTPRNNEDVEFRWDLICLHFLLKYLQSAETLRQVLCTKIEQSVSKEIQIKIFSRIHNLSLRWHLKRKTGEVLKIMDKSGDSVNAIINLLCLILIPNSLETFVSIGYFSFVFDIWFGIIIFIGMILYTWLLLRDTQENPNQLKKAWKAAYETKNKSIDSLLNFETVKYFGNEKYEINTFEKALTTLYATTFKSHLSSSLRNTAKELIVNSCLCVGGLLCAYKVVKKQLTLGDYVMCSTYTAQIYYSVDLFAYCYKSFQGYFLDLEHMNEILKEPQEIVDAPNAKEIEIIEGGLVFKNVFFEYTTGVPVIKNVSFKVPPGDTVALVGPSGSGKSTIVRLIFRFYDVNSGSILIDDQDIKEVTQESLRKSIGVVPQDTVLFNNTIRYNVKYGKPSANDEQIEEAAKRADIHEQILTFTDGYNTEVGERGLLMSGGEKQRIAIARTLLKSPTIFLLDEATSSLDTKTERNIQASLDKVCSSRTTIIVAHRLSTIIHADQILVMQEGTIVERGRHEELLELDGTYASMWRQQFVRNVEE